ncbi:hypothetical protein K0U07_01585 [bacterium]|nr:hypothetical protein [bacterium]
MSNNTIHEDLKVILADWEGICTSPELLEEKTFLEGMRHHILTLDSHLSNLPQHSEAFALLHHLLHTLPGAPVVSNMTLFECAKAEDASLYHYLFKLLSCSTGNQNFLFNSLALLDKKVA